MPLEMDIVDKKTRAVSLYSETIELVTAIQLLANSKHHEFAKDWADIIYSKLTDENLKFLYLISHMQLQGLEFIEFILNKKIYNDVEAFLKTILECESVEFLYLITGQQISLENIEKILKKEMDLSTVLQDNPWIVRDNLDVLELMFFKTDQFKKQAHDLFKAVYNNDFKKKLYELKDSYSQAVNKVNIEVLRVDPQDLVQELIGKKWKVKELKEYVFVPSYFISPHHIMIYNQNTMIVVYDMRSNKAIIDEKGHAVATRLKIMSDKTRLEILRLLISDSSYGKVMSATLNLSTATISHHLEQLKSANLVRENKVKNIKYFSANIEEIDQLLEDFKDYLYNK